MRPIVHRARKNSTTSMASMIRTLTFGVTISAFAFSISAPVQAVSDREIEDARYACITFMKDEGKKSRKKDFVRSQIARFWVTGFLTGAFDANEVLEFSDERDAAEGGIFARVREFCSKRDEVSFHAAAVYAGETPQPIPGVTNLGLDPRLYSCAAYSAGLESKGDKKSRAKAAEFWAFAFVQGNMTVRYDPRLVVSVSDKRKIVQALKRSCARNPTRNLLDQTAEIAGRVRPEWDAGDWD